MNITRTHQPLLVTVEERKTRRLYTWLSKITGVRACWLEGTDGQRKPVWGFIKQVFRSFFYVKSTRLVASAALVGVLSINAQQAQGQVGINLSDLRGVNGSVFNGVDAGDRAGRAVAVGDINGDGIDDLIISADEADPGGNSSAGETYVVFGSSSGFASSIELSELNGNTGFVINGIDAYDEFGRVVAAGDINGDGLDDVIIGVRRGDGNGYGTGETYVVFGRPSGFASSIESSGLDGSTGFVINGADNNDESGSSVASGDINGDGLDDVIIGAERAAPNGFDSGETYVVFGRTSGFASSVELSELNGNTGFVLNGIDEDDESGSSVASGDINGDGLDDVIIGAERADPNGFGSGETYVVFGQSSFTSSIELSSLDGSTGFVLNGIDAYDYSGRVAASGDINGDGFDDVIIGARYADPNGDRSGETYVVFGQSSFASSIELSELNGNTGFVLNGIDARDESGNSVAVGDINGDGLNDLVIGADDADPARNDRSGETYVVFGQSSFASSIELSSLDGSTGFVLNGIDEGDESGSSVAVGDINGDGLNDLVIGADDASPGGNTEAGQVYVFFNTASQQISGGEGFRMLSAPVSGRVYDELLDGLFTQGFAGSDAPQAAANVFTFDQASQNFVELANQLTGTLDSGQGFLFFIFSDDDGDGNPEGFPKRLSATQFGGEGTANSGTVISTVGLNDGEFFLAGNPYPFTIDWDDTDIIKIRLTNVIYIYDHAISMYRFWNGTEGNLPNGYIEPFQGFFIQGLEGGGSLILTEDAIAPSNGTFFKRLPDQPPRSLQFTATAGDTQTDAWVSFQEGGELGRDSFDAVYLQPLNPIYLRLATQVGDALMQLNALPLEQQEELVLPLDLSGTIQETLASLSIEGLEDFEGWQVLVRDRQSGAEFAFESDETVVQLAIEAIDTTAVLPLSMPVPTPMELSDGSTRYELILLPPGISVSTKEVISLPTEVALEQNFPNPFNPTTTIRFALPQASDVRLQVFDLLGREVARLVDARQPAGRFTVSFDASSLSSGIYIYRLQAGGSVLTRKLTLIK